MAKKDEEVDRQLSNMARAARKVGPNDRVVELRKVRNYDASRLTSETLFFGLFMFIGDPRAGGRAFQPNPAT